MKRILVMLALCCAVKGSSAQVMPPDSTNKELNSAESRREGLHTSGATEANKPTPKEPAIVSPSSAGPAKNKSKAKTSKRAATAVADSARNKME